MQLDYDEEMEPLNGMYGSMEAENEVAAFLCLLRKVCGPIKVIIDGLRKG